MLSLQFTLIKDIHFANEAFSNEDKIKSYYSY